MVKLMEGPSIESLALETARLLADSATDGAAAAEETWEPLLALRSTGTRPPLVLLPALGGDVRCYGELVQQLGDDQPVYAFRPRGADQELAPHVTIDEMIADYLAALRVLQPAGPYHLAGWSTGGIFAFALAEALERSGEEVALVALFDTPLPSICDDIDVEDDLRFLCDLINYASRFSGIEFIINCDDLARLEPERRFSAALNEARNHGIIPGETPESFIRRLVEVGKANVRVIQSYDAKPIDAPTQLFVPRIKTGLAEVSGREVSTQLDNGWEAVIGQTTQLHEVPGDHFTMMLGDSAAAMVDTLSTQMTRSTVDEKATGQPAR
jgi:thioesterase domain-containing protein